MADAYEQDACHNLQQVTTGEKIDTDKMLALGAIVQAQAMLAVSHRLGYLSELFDGSRIRLKL